MLRARQDRVFPENPGKVLKISGVFEHLGYRAGGQGREVARKLEPSSRILADFVGGRRTRDFGVWSLDFGLRGGGRRRAGWSGARHARSIRGDGAEFVGGVRWEQEDRRDSRGRAFLTGIFAGRERRMHVA